MEIIEALKDGICSINITLKRDQIVLDESLMSSGTLDSMGFVEFIGFIENKFNIVIEDDEVNMDNFKNLNVIEAFIKRKKG